MRADRREYHRLYARRWRAAHPEYKTPARVEAQRLRSRACKLRRYGLTAEQFNQKQDAQGNRCAICQEFFRGTPHVDHDHATGEVRGLLCSSCNRAIGLLKDSSKVCAQAAEYLKRYEVE